ncbi:MAG: hypothetical protein OQL20_06140 [Sedimenticola sp.]|nr:hypothetical protein [Sedimenticola sp.]
MPISSPKALLFIALGLLLPLLAGCSGDQASPEEQIRVMLSAGERAVESRSVSAVQAHISEQYQDESGNDGRALARLLTGYFITHQSIHLLMQIGPITLMGADQAETTVFVAVAGQPLEATADLLSLRADLLRFDLKLVNEASQWRVRSARWRRANSQDFLR